MSSLKWCLKNQQVTRCYRKAVCFILTFTLLLVPSFTSVRAADLPAETSGSESDSENAEQLESFTNDRFTVSLNNTTADQPFLVKGFRFLAYFLSISGEGM
ncbi:MAG: hypothetical protein SCM11_14670 [Bacillota bacterium]|nr:hypothetical protein [Bacillota bacterium]